MYKSPQSSLDTGTIMSLRELIASAGPGQTKEVLSDLHVLDKSSSGYEDEVRAYNTTHFTVAKSGDVNVLLSRYNQLDNDTYFDPISQKKFSYDHTTEKISNVEPHDVEVPTMTKEVQEYVTEHFTNGHSLVVNTKEGVKVCIVGERLNQSNFWTARWCSEYLITQTITGKIELDVHYYESGNIRFLASKHVEGQSIREIERKYHAQINSQITAFSESGFKGLRRQLPVTRSKINWDSIASMRIGQEVLLGE